MKENDIFAESRQYDGFLFCSEYFILNIRDDLLMERRIEYSGRLITGCRKYLNYRRI